MDLPDHTELLCASGTALQQKAAKPIPVTHPLLVTTAASSSSSIVSAAVQDSRLAFIL